MSDVQTDNQSLANEAVNISQSTLDFFNFSPVIPVTKLDADQYMASDMDGVTESLFGSGNLNYLMLQAGQTNEALFSQDFMNNAYDDNFFAGNPGGGSSLASQDFSGSGGGNLFSGSGRAEHDAASDTDRPVGNDHDFHETSSSAENSNLSIGTLGSLGSAKTASIQNYQSSNGGDFTNIQNGADGRDGKDATPVTVINGDDGTNGKDGVDGNGNGDTFIDIDIGDTLIDLGDVSNFLTVTVTEISNIIQHIDLSQILNITEVLNSVTNITNDLTSTVTNLFGTVNNVTNNVGDTVTNLFDTVNNTTNNVTTIVTNIFENIFNHGGGGNFDLSLNLHTIVDDLTNVDLGLNINDTIDRTLNVALDLTDVLTGPVEIPNIAGLDLESVLHLGPYDGSPADTDLVIDGVIDLTGLDIPDIHVDIPLDIVETIIGDIDLNISAIVDVPLDLSEIDLADLAGSVENLVDIPAIIDTVTDGLGLPNTGIPDLDLGYLNLGGMGFGNIDLDILNLEDITLGNGAHGGDTDIGSMIDINAGGVDVVTGSADVILDVVEDLAGDIDLAPSLGLDLLSDNETSNSAGDTDIYIDLGFGLADDGLASPTIDIPLDAIENVTGDIDLDLSSATNILGDIAESLIDHAAGGTGGDNLLADLSDGVADLVHHVDFSGVDLGGVDATLENAGDLVGGITGNGDLTGGIDLSGLTPDLSGIDFNGTSPPDVVAGADISLLDHTVVPDLNIDSILDPAEGIVGDVDVGAGLGLDLLGTNETSNSAGDTDLALNVDLAVPGIDLSPIAIEVMLDPLESITGDIDLNIGAALDLLHPSPSDGGAADITGPDTEPVDISWPQNILPDPGSILSHVADSVSAVLPEPVGHIAEGLGGLFDNHHHSGGHHFGGLFG